MEGDAEIVSQLELTEKEQNILEEIARQDGRGDRNGSGGSSCPDAF